MRCCSKAKQSEDDEYKTSMQNYYTIAHSSREEITSQPTILKFGQLKPYQVRSPASPPSSSSVSLSRTR